MEGKSARLCVSFLSLLSGGGGGGGGGPKEEEEEEEEDFLVFVPNRHAFNLAALVVGIFASQCNPTECE